MEETDYGKCSKAELADILNHIDRDKFPERAAEIQAIYDQAGGTDSFRFEVSRRPGRFWTGLIFTIWSSIVMVRGIDTTQLFYSITVESLPARILAGLAVLFCGLLLLGGWGEDEN